MAPRRGGGGGSSGGSSGISASCPHPFTDDYFYSTPVAYFVFYCLFFVAFLGVLVAWAKVKKRHPNAGKLVGPIYGLSVLFILIRYALGIIGTMLRECGTTDFNSYYNWAIAWVVFRELAGYLLLVVVLYGVNNVLRNRLGSNPSFFKIIYGVVLGLLFMLTAAYIGLECFNLWLNTDQGMDSFSESLGWEEARLATSYFVLYLLAVILAGAISVASILSMRSSRISTTGLKAPVIVLIASMFIWVLFVIIECGATLAQTYLGIQTYQAFTFIEDFFQLVAWTALLFIAKAPALKPHTDNTNPNIYNQPTYAQAPPHQTYAPAPVPQPQQQYAYTHDANGNQYNYHQQPIYNGTAELKS